MRIILRHVGGYGGEQGEPSRQPRRERNAGGLARLEANGLRGDLVHDLLRHTSLERRCRHCLVNHGLGAVNLQFLLKPLVTINGDTGDGDSLPDEILHQFSRIHMSVRNFLGDRRVDSSNTTPDIPIMILNRIFIFCVHGNPLLTR